MVFFLLRILYLKENLPAYRKDWHIPAGRSSPWEALLFVLQPTRTEQFNVLVEGASELLFSDEGK